MSQTRSSKPDIGRRPASRERGFSLIEVMIGLVISLIGTFAMMQAFAMFEGQKRTTTSGSDAQQSGSFSLYQMERQIRTAGSAITQGRSSTYNIYMCAITANGSLPLGGALAAPFAGVPLTIRAIPALIYSGGAGNSDVISVISGNPVARTFGVGIYSASGAQVVMQDSAFGIFQGEYLLAGTLPGSGPCVLGKATTVSDPTPALPPAPPNNLITLDATAGATGFAGQTYLFDLGTDPVLSLFGVDTTAGALMEYDLLQRPPGALREVADGIVALKALYGVDDGAAGGILDDGIIDEWVAPTGSWSAATLSAPATGAVALPRIKAIRVAVVARSQLSERDTDYSGATTLTLFKDIPALQYNVTTDTHFRYKLYDTTIPLHNASVKIL